MTTTPAGWRKRCGRLEGVLEAQVSFATERARVRYIPTVVSQADLRRAVAAAGFEAVETGGEAEDAERLAREAEIDQQRHYLIVGLIFTVPLFLFSMARDLGLLPMSIAHAGVAAVADVRPGHPGAVLCRPAVLRRGV